MSHSIHFGNVLLASLGTSAFFFSLLIRFRYIKVTQDIDTRFPEATPEQLQGADVCAVCLMQMETGRVLRCGHICHRRCLLTWFEHSQSCPMCRESVVDEDIPNQPQGLNPQQQQQFIQMQFYVQQLQAQQVQQQFNNGQFNNANPPQPQHTPHQRTPQATPHTTPRATPYATPQPTPQPTPTPTRVSHSSPQPSLVHEHAQVGPTIQNSNERLQQIMASVFRLQEQMVDLQLELQQLHGALNEHMEAEQIAAAATNTVEHTTDTA